MSGHPSPNPKTLYIVSGPPRAGKTTIMSALVAERHVQFVAGDAVEHGMRNLLTGEPHQFIGNIEFSGSAERRESIMDGGAVKPFSNKGSETGLTLQTIEGMLDYYRRANESVAFEGSIFDPGWVSSQNMPGYTIRAAYVGYTDPNHADSIMTHAKTTPHDWINHWLESENGDETKIRGWITRQAKKCQQLKAEAESHGYPFFDVSMQPFDTYKAAVLDYLLKPRNQ